MRKDSRIWVTGGSGLVGSALLRALKKRGFASVSAPTHGELDLTDRAATEAFYKSFKPEFVLHAAAKVGGIQANSSLPADFIFQNLAIGANVIDLAFRHGVTRLLNFNSSCVYPKHGRVPLKEDSVLTGAIEPTNEPYAVAKIAAMKLCEAYNRQHGTDFLTVVPANLYGPGDHFTEAGHVVAGLIKRFTEAKAAGDEELVIWGSGKPRRDFLYVDDLAEACLLLMERPGKLPWAVVNVGSGKETSIKALAALVKKATGFKGKLRYDTDKPDGIPRRFLDNSRIVSLGWKPRTPLPDGLARTVRWFLDEKAASR